MIIKKAEIQITGKVQGVFFRQTAKEQADKLNLTGWTQNNSAGSVVILAEGEEEKLQKLVEWAKIGTEWSKIDKVEVNWKEATGEFKDFSVK